MESNNQEKNGFSYTYSAREQAELRKIREKYTPPAEEEDKLSRLRRLDRSVATTARGVSLVHGIVGALILGGGLSLCTTELGAAFGMSGAVSMGVGIGIGLAGGALAAVAYPIYNAIVKAKRKKLAPEILRLTDELLK